MRQRKSIRLKNYNYATAGYYFVTVCTQNRECLFGNIVNGKITINNIGKVANHWWNELPTKFENVSLDTYQIMPNHFHGILIINSAIGRDNRDIIGRDNRDIIGRDNRAPTTLGQIVAFFKYQTTKYVNQLSVGAGSSRPETGSSRRGTIQKIWQRNYYEHIVRNENELQKIRKYIIENPIKWDNDSNNPKN